MYEHTSLSWIISDCGERRKWNLAIFSPAIRTAQAKIISFLRKGPKIVATLAKKSQNTKLNEVESSAVLVHKSQSKYWEEEESVGRQSPPFCVKNGVKYPPLVPTSSICAIVGWRRRRRRKGGSDNRSDGHSWAKDEVVVVVDGDERLWELFFYVRREGGTTTPEKTRTDFVQRPAAVVK